MNETNLTEITLSTGWKVKCRAVPSLAIRGIYRKPEHQYPSYPTVEVTTMGGKGSERVPAPDGSPEALEYLHRRHQVDVARDEAVERFTFGYGVHSWQAPDGDEWLVEPPDSWGLDPALAGAVGDVPPRAAFIMYDLLAHNKDLELVQAAIFGREEDPIAPEEVDAAEASFPGDVE